MFLIREKDFHYWIYIVILCSTFSALSFQSNETTRNGSSSTTTPQPTMPLPLPPHCIDKKILNVCWLKTPPYIFDNPNNKSRVEGILPDAIIKGFGQCECQVRLNFTLRVYDETDLVNCSNDKSIDLVIPFPRRGIMNKKTWFFKVVDSAAIYLLFNRKKIESKAKENIIFEFSQVWTLAVLTILLAVIFGIIIWSLDSAWNRNQFPPSFCPGAMEGIWWSFVTLTTVGYGDKTPKFPLARIFAVIWMFVGMCLVSLLTATMTKALTTGLVENRQDFQNLKIGVLQNSYSYDEAVKKGAKTQTFRELKTMYTALNDDDIQGILLDIFVATYVRNNLALFNFRANITVAQSYDILYSIGYSYGNGLAEYDAGLYSPITLMSNCIKSEYARIDVFSIVDQYIQAHATDESKLYDQYKIEINLFAPSSEFFLMGLKALCIICGILICFGIVWQIIRCRWQRSFQLPKQRGETIAMSAHERMTTENIKKMAKKLEEVETALCKVMEFREVYEHCRVDIDRYNSVIPNGNPNGTANSGFANNA